MRLCKTGANPDGFVKTRNRFLALALIQESGPKVIVCLRKIRVDPESLFVLIRRLLVLGLVQIDTSKVIM